MGISGFGNVDVFTGHGTADFMQQLGVDKVMDFRREEFARTFPNRSPKEIARFAGTEISWVDPNQSRLRGRFSFVRAFATITPTDQMTNMIQMANNASGRLPGPLAYPEQMAKLWLPTESARRHRIAYIREMLGPDREAKALLTALSLADYHPGQPVRYYAYKEEAGDVHEMLEEWGLEPLTSAEEPVLAFGSDAHEAVQVPYVGAAGAEAIMHKIIEVENIEAAFHAAMPIQSLDN